MIKRVNTLSRSTKTSTSVALLAIVAVAGYGWIVAPYVTYLRAVQRCQPAVEKTVDRKDTMSKALGVKRRRLKELETELVALREKFFTAAQSRVFFSDLERWSVDAGCEVLALNCVFDADRTREETGVDGPVVMRQSTNLTVSGTYEALTTLLEHLEDSRREVSVDACRMELSDISSGRRRCDLDLTIWVIPEKEDSTGA
jgi:hypothetical protein